jgi:phospholipid/cholesterol/gamma-HCH transport system substrate-binding protein
MSKQRSSDVKVGVFVAIGIIATFISLFVIGQERKLWERSVHLKARFSNVAGLKVGGQIRLAGISVGIVSKILLPELDPGADAAVAKPIDLGTVPVPEGQALVDHPLVLLQNTFADPINIAVLATDSDEKLEAAVEVIGVDFHGAKARERVLLRLRGADGVAVGATYFSKIESIHIKVLKDANPGASLQIGDGTSRKITVDMRVSENILERIRTDSVAAVQQEGLFGDKFIDISIGSLSKPALADGDMLPSDEGVDIAAALASTGEIIDNVNASTESIRVLLDGFRKAGGEATVVAAMQSIQDIADEIQHGNGLVHQLIFDRKAGEQYKDIVGDVSASTRTVKASLAKVDGILDDVKSNKSLVHELLYGTEGDAVVADARKLIGEATTIVTDVRTKPGLVHNLIYEEDKGQIMTSINAAAGDVKEITGDVKQIVANVKSGKGTVGQLLNDPTVYEDLKMLLGNVRRNDAVRTLVRFAVEQEERKATTPPQKAP